MARPVLENLTFALTYECNSRCKICDIWKVKKRDALSLDEIRKVLESDAAKSVKCVFLTGGEPFMRPDLIDVVDLIKERKPDSFLLISTNGLCRDETLDFLKRCKHDVTLSFSVDGIKKHDLQRGVDGAFARTMETIERVEDEFPEQEMVFKFTITPLNHDEILDVYRLAKKHGAVFHVKPVEELNSYTMPEKTFETKFSMQEVKEIDMQLKLIFQEFLKENHLHDALFIKQIPGFLQDRGSISIDCEAADNSLFIMPDGAAYLCLYLDPVGNVKKDSIDEIWTSVRSQNVREIVRGGNCPVCLSYHGSYSSHRKLVK